MMKWQPKVSFWVVDRFVSIALDNDSIKQPERWYGMACAKYAGEPTVRSLPVPHRQSS